MDYHNLKRKELQELCKKHGIPANLTNSEMANKLNSLLKVNDEKPLTRGRSCLKVVDENNVNDREPSDNRKVKKVKFSPEIELFEFTKSVKRGGRSKSMSHNNSSLNVGAQGRILDSPVRVTRSQRITLEDAEKKGSVASVNESMDEVGVTTRRSLRNKEVEVSENEGGANEGLGMSRRRSRKNAKKNGEELKMEELNKSTGEKEIHGAEKRDKKVALAVDGEMNECTKRGRRRKSIANTQPLHHVQNEVAAELREEAAAEKPARVTRSRNLKSVEDDVNNKRNQTRGKEAIERSEMLVCTEYVESSVAAVKDEVRVTTRSSQQNSVVEAPQKNLKRSNRLAEKVESARLTDNITEDKIVTRGRGRKKSNLAMEASTLGNGTKINEPVIQLEEPVEAPSRKSDRRKSVIPSLEKLRSDESVAVKEKRGFSNANDDEIRNKGTKEEPPKALKQSKRLTRQEDDSVVAKDDVAVNEVVPHFDKLAEEPARRSRKSRHDTIRFRSTNSEQFNSHEANINTRILDRSEQVEFPVLNEERRSGRNASRHTSDEKKEIGENKLTKRNHTAILKKNPTKNKFSLQDLASSKQSTSSSEAGMVAAVVEKTNTGGTKQQGRQKRSTVEAPTPEDVAITREPDSIDCISSESEGTRSFSKPGENELEAVPDDVNIVLAGTKDEQAVESSTLADELIKEGPLVDAGASLSKTNCIYHCPPICDPSNSSVMDFYKMKRKELQALCKKHGIPANLTNLEMASKLSSLLKELSVTDYAKEFDAGLSSNVSLDNVGAFNPCNETEVEISEYSPMEQAEAGFIASYDRDAPTLTTQDELDAEEYANLDDTISTKEFSTVSQSNHNAVGNSSASTSEKSCDHKEQSTTRSWKNIDFSYQTYVEPVKYNEGDSEDHENGPDEGTEYVEFEATEEQESTIDGQQLRNNNDNEGEYLEDQGNGLDEGMQQLRHCNASEGSVEAAVSVKTVSSPLKVLDLPVAEPAVLGDGITLNTTPLADNHEEKQEEMKASSEGDSRLGENIVTLDKEVKVSESDESLNRGGQAAPIAGHDLRQSVTSLKDTSEDEKSGEELQGLFAIPCYVSQSLTPLKETPEDEEAGEELKGVFSTPSFVSQSVTPLKETFEGEEAGKELKGLFATPSSVSQSIGGQPSDLQSPLSGEAMTRGECLGSCRKENLSESVGTMVENEQGEQSRNLCASPVSVKTMVEETASTKAKYSKSREIETFNCSGEKIVGECKDGSARAPETSKITAFNYNIENEHASPSAGNDLTLSVAPLKDTSEDDKAAGEELKGLFATPFFVSQSIGGQPSHLQCQLSGEARTKVEGLGSSGKENPSESVRDLIEDKQGELLRNLVASPVSVKPTAVETTSTKVKSSQSHGMGTFSCNGMEQNLGDCEDGSTGVNQASPSAGSDLTQSVTPLKDTSKDDDVGEELKGLFATPFFASQSVGGRRSHIQSQLSGEAMTMKEGLGSSGKENLSESVSGMTEDKQGEQRRSLFTSPDSAETIVEKTTSTKAKYSQDYELETFICSGMVRSLDECKDGSAGIKQASPSAGNDLTHSVTPLKNTSDDDEAGEELKGLFATPSLASQSIGGRPHLQNRLSGEAMTMGEGLGSTGKENLTESVSGMIEDERGEQLRTLFASPVSVKTTVVATTSPETNYSQSHQMEIFNRSGLEINFGECEDGSAGVKQATETSHLSAFNYNDKNEQASACAGNDLTQSVIPLKDTSEDNDAGEELKGSFATPFLVSQSIGEGPGSIGKENLSESVNDLIENQQEEQLRNSFASPVSVKAPVEEAISTCQLKTAMIAIASEMVGKEDMCKGFEISGEPLTVEIISGDSYSTKRACFLKENEEQCKRGPLFATPAKGKSPMQYAESPDCQLMEADTALSTEGIDSKATNKHQGSPLVTKEAKESCEPSKERDELEHIGGSLQCIKEFNFPKEEDYTEWSQPFASSDVDSQALDHCPGSANEVFTASKSSKYGKEREIIYEGKTPASDEVKYGDNYVGSVEDIFKDLDGDKFLNSEEQVFAHYEDCQLLREMTDDTGEATLHWFQTNDGGVPRQTELETQNENDSVLQLEPFQEKGEVTEDAPAEGETDDHQLTSQESLEDRSLNIKEAAKGGSVSDTVCLQPNVLLTDFETKNINEQSNQGHDSIENIDGISLSAESEFVAFDAESTTLRSQEIIIIAQEYKGDEVQKLEVRKMSNANIPNSGESAKEISIVLTADKQLHFPEHHVIDNVASTGELTASENECQDFCKEFDVAARRDSDSRQSSLATQQDEYSFDKKKHEAIESVISPSSKFRVKNNFSEEGFAGGDTSMSRKISGLAKKKGPSTPAGVAKTSFAKHLNSTVKKNNARTILIHGTPNKLSHKADMKENAVSVKGESIGTLTTLRPEKRRVLTMLPWK